jgi:hypothetical protein
MIRLKTLILESTAAPFLSEAIRYHIDNRISITENIFRGQSPASFKLVTEARALYELDAILLEGLDEQLFAETDLGLWGDYDGCRVPLDYPIALEEGENPCWKGYEMIGMKMKDGKEVPNCVPVNEAIYQGKDVELNKPKRGGSRKFYVYTKNEKGNVVKVSFGDTSGLSVKLRDPKAVKSFVARHKCGTGEKRWTARYWSCRLPRYASLLGLKGKTSGYW